MHRIFVTMVFVAAVSFGESAKADPSRWCAHSRGGRFGGGGTNCYFVTLAQCRAAVSGVGGFCVPNNFYDGRPVVTPEDGVRRRRG